MGKRALFLGVIALGCILATGCGDKKGQEASASAKAKQGGDREAVAESAEPAVWGGEYQCKKGDPECESKDDTYFAGTVFNTVSNTDANVRSVPSTKGEVLFQLKKETKVQITGVTRDGWAYIVTKEPFPRRGWVFGQYVDYKEGQKLAGITELKVEKFSLVDRSDSSSADLIVSYRDGGADKSIGSLRATKVGKFYTFFFDIHSENSHYRIIPGIYAWDYAKNQLRHAITLHEPLVETVHFLTDDLKFYATAHPHTNPDFNPSGAEVVYSLYRSSDSRQLANNMENLKIKGNTATIPCLSDDLAAEVFGSKEKMADAISEYIEEYRRKTWNEAEDADTRAIGAECDVNLQTGAMKIVGTIYYGH